MRGANDAGSGGHGVSTADVVVIGGGIAGTSVAYHLARQRAGNIVLLEREALIGTGATQASAGGSRKLFSAEVNVRMSVESQAVFARFGEEMAQRIDFRRTGYVLLAITEAELAGYRENLATLAKVGVPDARLIGPDEVRRLIPQLSVDDVLGAIHCPSDGHLSPAAVTEGFARQAQRLGVRVVPGAEVVGIERTEDRVAAVRTAAERIETRCVVNAAGAHAGEVAKLADVQLDLTPRRRLIYVTRAAQGIADDCPMTFDFQTWFYFRREGAGVLIGTGNTREPASFNTAADWDFLAQLSAGMFRRLPVLADAEVEHAWGGCEGYTSDGSALLGPTEQLEGFFLACGFSGHGVMHSPASGRIVADLILGRDVGYDVSDLHPDRFRRGVARSVEAIVVSPEDVELPEA